MDGESLLAVDNVFLHGWFGKYLSLALMLPASVAGGFFVGRWLDSHFRKDYFTLIFIFVGMAGGIVQVVRELARDDKR